MAQERAGEALEGEVTLRLVASAVFAGLGLLRLSDVVPWWALGVLGVFTALGMVIVCARTIAERQVRRRARNSARLVTDEPGRAPQVEPENVVPARADRPKPKRPKVERPRTPEPPEGWQGRRHAARALLIFFSVAAACLALWLVLQYFFSDDVLQASFDHAGAVSCLAIAVVFAREARSTSREATAEAVRPTARG